MLGYLVQSVGVKEVVDFVVLVYYVVWFVYVVEGVFVDIEGLFVFVDVYFQVVEVGLVDMYVQYCGMFFGGVGYCY